MTLYPVQPRSLAAPAEEGTWRNARVESTAFAQCPGSTLSDIPQIFTEGFLVEEARSRGAHKQDWDYLEGDGGSPAFSSSFTGEALVGNVQA